MTRWLALTLLLIATGAGEVVARGVDAVDPQTTDGQADEGEKDARMTTKWKPAPGDDKPAPGGKDPRKPREAPGAASDDAQAPATSTPTAASEAAPATTSPAASSATAGRPARGVEPRPRLRMAREVLDELAQDHLWSWNDLQLERPKEEVTRLFAPATAPTGQHRRVAAIETTALEGVLQVTATAGPLPLRAYDAHVSLWWDDLGPLVDRVAQLSRAASLVSVDLHEVPPPSRDMARPKVRVLRLQGDLRIAALGYEPEAIPADGAQGVLDTAKRWLEARAELGRPLAAALGTLPPECVIERLYASRERLEVRLAGIRPDEADKYADRLQEMPEIGSLYAGSDVSREADTFIIRLERK